MNNLKKEIEFINQWCLESKTPIFHTDIDSEIKSIKWNSNNEKENNIESFIGFLNQFEPGFILLDIDFFEYDFCKEEYEETTHELKKAKEKFIELDKLIELDKYLKSKDKEIIRYEIAFVNNGYSFSYSKFASFLKEFGEFQEIIDKNHTLNYLQERALINDSLLNTSKQLANFNLFKNATNKPQRELAADFFLRTNNFDKEVYINSKLIVEYADSMIKLNITD
jgi:hypothetical protein